MRNDLEALVALLSGAGFIAADDAPTSSPTTKNLKAEAGALVNP